MEIKFKELSPIAVIQRMATEGGPVRLFVAHVAKDDYWISRRVVGVDLEDSPYPIKTGGSSWKYAAMRHIEFGECPSPHGWHNPEGLTPEKIIEYGQELFGPDVDVENLRLLAEDEIGFREGLNPAVGARSVNSVTEYGPVRTRGRYEHRTYFTDQPYGRLPAPEDYAIPECAPYGFSRKTGKRLYGPEGYGLVPEGRLIVLNRGECQVVTPNGDVTSNWEGAAYLVSHSEVDAVFFKETVEPTPRTDAIIMGCSVDVYDQVAKLTRFSREMERQLRGLGVTS